MLRLHGVNGGRREGSLREERGISRHSWQDRIELDGRLQLEQIAVVSRAVRAMAFMAASCVRVASHETA